MLAWKFEVLLPNVNAPRTNANSDIGLRRRLTKIVRSALGVASPEAETKNMNAQQPIDQFIPLRETLAGAKAAGMSVGDYIERNRNTGATQETIDRIAQLGVFQNEIARVCEIGPGSGRYLERVAKACRPGYYEIYETARDWSDWLVKAYGVTPQPCDGTSLSPTPSQSIDLVHAHKVFVGLPFLITCHYLNEMVRVARDGGWIIFDVLTEDCMDEKSMAAWLAVRPGTWEWTPTLVPKPFLIPYLGRHGAQLAGSFFISLWPGKTEVFVFRKNST